MNGVRECRGGAAGSSTLFQVWHALYACPPLPIPSHTHTHKKVFTTKKLQWCRGLISGVHGSSTLYPGVLFSTAA